MLTILGTATRPLTRLAMINTNFKAFKQLVHFLLAAQAQQQKTTTKLGMTTLAHAVMLCSYVARVAPIGSQPKTSNTVVKAGQTSRQDAELASVAAVAGADPKLCNAWAPVTWLHSAKGPTKIFPHSGVSSTPNRQHLIR